MKRNKHIPKALFYIIPSKFIFEKLSKFCELWVYLKLLGFRVQGRSMYISHPHY